MLGHYATDLCNECLLFQNPPTLEIAFRIFKFFCVQHVNTQPSKNWLNLSLESIPGGVARDIARKRRYVALRVFTAII